MNIMVNAASKPMMNYTVKTVEEFTLRLEQNRVSGRNFTKYINLCDKVHSDEKSRQECHDAFEAPLGGVHKPPYPSMHLVYVHFDAIPDP